MPPMTNTKSTATAHTSFNAVNRSRHDERGPRRAPVRMPPGGAHDGPAEQERAEDARQDARGEELADVGLGEDAVDDHDRGRRDHDPERARARHRAGRELVVVAEALHGRVRHLGHGGRGRDGGAADAAEARRGPHGGHREAAAKVPDEGVGGAEELLRHAGAGDEVAHQDEERHHRERVVPPGLVDLGLGGREGHPPVPVAHVGVADDAHDAHRVGDGDAQEGQHHHQAEPHQPLDHRRAPIL